MDYKDKIVYMGTDQWIAPLEPIILQHGFTVVKGDFHDAGLESAWAMLPGREYVTEELLQKTPNLKLIAKIGVGLDRIDIDACTRHKVCVANTPKSNGVSVAEHTMALMLAAAKNLYPISLYTRNDYPDFTCIQRYPAMELEGRTVVVIGVGNIGTKVAKFCNCFGMKVIGVDPFIEHSGMPEYIEWADTMEDALPLADIVTVHVSARHENDKMLSEKQFSLMKKNALFINTSRGFVVDEAALYKALVNKQIAGAGLDVFAEEPWKPFNPIRKLENVVCSPHAAANTPAARVRGREECGILIKEFAEGIWPYSAANDFPRD